ncbi:MAG: adenylate kinase [Anaerolineales bacterium]|nr:adenylate kinase [Anaerolineales bacterium]MCB8938016.1 adenylate kinase [Ardenticatenaceae bacterium]
MKTFVVLMGAPGAGKGTQAKRLQVSLGLPQVATGDLFRANLKNETALGKLARTYMDKGELVPDEVTVAMVQDRLSQSDCEGGAILDGFPRTTAQAEALDELLEEFSAKIAVVPFIDVNQDVLVERLAKRAEIEGRADDNEETIRVRMEVYRSETAPLLNYYKEKGLLVKVNGEQSIDEVTADLTNVVQKVM